MSDDLSVEIAKLKGSLLLFTQVFYKLRTGRNFEISQPTSRESHFIEISKGLTKVFRGQTKKLGIHVPPRYGKTELLIHFVAWALANYPDSNFLYVSYSHSLAKKQTQTIKQIIELPHYRKLFNVEISSDTSAKDNFETTNGGSVYAAGAQGTITGRGAGIRNCERYGGSIVIDDIIKPAEASSDAVRESTNDWYFNTLLSRLNNPNTSIINSGQRTNEADLASIFINDPEWEIINLPAIDGAGNALYPSMHDKATLLKMEADSPYVFAAQYQQNPQPAGGGIFKPEWFVQLDEEPEIVATFITADTAETDKSYNDATVFSFWGIYKIKECNVDINLWGLHWIDCYELRVEPKDLEPEFRQFYSNCLHHKVKPKLAGIEKKSTGATLLSVLGALRGLHLIDIERTKASGNKTARYLEGQPYVASKRVSFTKHAKHVDMCIEHCRKITANNSHRHDDIADTLYDAIKIGLIDEIVSRGTESESQADNIVKLLANNFNNIQNVRAKAYG